MSFRINVAKKYKTEMRGGKEHNLYRHYFKIETEMFYAYTKELVQEMQEKYPAPEYKVELYRETSYSEQVKLAEKETV
jgi:hypothetical protein